MINMITSILLLSCSAIANTSVDAFACTPHHLSTGIKNKPFISQMCLYETVDEEEEVNTLLHCATIYGDLVADENIWYVNPSTNFERIC